MTSATQSTFDPSPGENAFASRAATLLLIAGVLEMLAFGLLTLFCLSVAGTPLAELQAQLKLPAEQVEILANFQKVAVAAVTMALLGVVPGLAYVLLSFGVRSSKYVPTQIVLLLVATQTIVFGILFIAYAFEAVRQANPVMLTFDVVTLGSLLALLVFIIRNLLQARVGARLRLQSDREPWDSPDE